MALVELENRIRILEDIEDIKKLKSKYWYCVDKKLWDELGDCFTDDAITEGRSGQKKGKDSIIRFNKNRLGNALTVHQGHNPSIEILDATSARGRWVFYEKVTLDTRATEGFKGWGFYDDEYVKEKGKWKIKSSIITRLLRENWQREF